MTREFINFYSKNINNKNVTLTIIGEGGERQKLEELIEKLKEKHGDFGSGYPSDPTTKQFVDKLVREGNLPDYVRKSWGTIEKSKQSSLDDF